MNVPEHLIYPLEEFADEYVRLVRVGEAALASASVAFVGLARNCAPHLEANLRRLEKLAEGCREWRLHIETNDNTDDTDQVLIEFCRRYPKATFLSQRLDRKQYTTEFAGRRTIALAEYRTACQKWVREHASDADFVVVVDWDAWGGWSHSGFMHGLGCLIERPGAYGMASVSLIEHPVSVADEKGARMSVAFVTYDAWAMRGVGQPTNYWDDYTAGLGGWKHQWIPPVGSPPVILASAFGGMAIYDTHAYLKGAYDGSDCEHVGFHRTIAKCTGQNLYLDPSMRMIMNWLERTAD
jgi:hypothetical protein